MGSVDMSGRTSIACGLLVWAGSLSFLAACTAATEAEFAPAELFCEATRGAYCILNTELTIKTQRATRDSGAVLTLYRESWQKDPAIIIEPKQCAARVADTAEILDYVDDYRWRGELWDRMVVRLHSGGQCDFQLLFPDGEREAGSSALWTLLSQVRICEKEPCSGRTLGEAIGEDLRKRDRFPVGF